MTVIALIAQIRLMIDDPLAHLVLILLSPQAEASILPVVTRPQSCRYSSPCRILVIYYVVMLGQWGSCDETDTREITYVADNSVEV